MTESNRSRNNSFRKLFSGGFFFKTRSRHSRKDQHSSNNKNGVYNSSVTNQYQTPRLALKSTPSDDCTYENLSIYQRPELKADGRNNEVTSNRSSSSTLVAEGIKHNEIKTNKVLQVQQLATEHRPEMKSPHKEVQSQSQYPDVYYHSLEKLSEVTLLNEAGTFKGPHNQSDLTSVGAEIKKISTKILTSPKKEAEVRTLQPSRAQSLSFEKRKVPIKKLDNVTSDLDNGTRKPYNYSAPTSPISPSHRIPNMPKTVSPYGHVRKTMIEAEEKRNSLTIPRSQSKCSASPAPSDCKTLSRAATPTDAVEKEKTRQIVEAFYWQKLKELKNKEDEYLLRQSMNSPLGREAYPSSCNTPNSYNLEARSSSLQRGMNLNSNSAKRAQTWQSPFNRDVPERRTDTFMFMKHRHSDESGVVYRHSEKLMPRNTFPGAAGAQHKRGSLEEQSSPRTVSIGTGENKESNNDAKNSIVSSNKGRLSSKMSMMMTPPLPPVRTTSVGSSDFAKKYSMRGAFKMYGGHNSIYSESECSSEAGEIQRIFQADSMNLNARKEEDWHADARIDGGLSDGEAGRGPRGRTSRRDDPRRHTLAGNHLYVHPHHNQHNSLDMERPYGPAWALPPPAPPEYATVVKFRNRPHTQIPYLGKPPLPRYPPQTNAMLFDDDPGIMSEVETASTGFRRGGKQRSSLPVVRTPSKTLERPLGLVFLQYRNETKRALLPNEITSIDTVKALFVRSFPKQLTMQYMDSPLVKIYIHDSSKDMFYELEDVRAHLRDIRDRSVLRLFEAADITGGVFPGAVGVGSLAMPPPVPACSGPSSWDQDQSYFSEPEIDSEYHHQHVHKSKVKAPAYYIGGGAGGASTLPRGGPVLRAYSPAAPPLPADRVKPLPASGHGSEGYMSSPERGGARVPYEDPYYTQFLGPAAGRPPIAPVIDEETNDSVIIDDSYQMYGVNPLGTGPRPMPRAPYDTRLNTQVDEMQRLRVEKMERQLANLTGLVQKALQAPAPGPGAPPPAAPPRQEYPAYAARPPHQDAARFPSNERPPKLGRDKFQKSVSFEKSVSFSDDPPDMNSPKQHSPQHSADTKPTKPAIKSSTLPRTSSQERDRLKPAPPPKPVGLVGQQLNMISQRTYTINVSPDFFNQLRVLQKQSRDLRIETRNLRRSTLSHAIQMRQLMADTIVKIGALAATFCEHDPESQLAREEEIYRQDMLLLENDLYELEATVERLRGQAANRETRVNMADIERIAMVLSKSSKTVADWKLKFPILQNTMKVKLSSEMEKVVRKEKMLEEEPERLELALRRCKKLTGTLVTLKRLACVQEQRLPTADGRLSPGSSQSSSFTAGPSSEECASDSTCHAAQPHNKGTGAACVGGAPSRGPVDVRPENALDALLDELQTFAKPATAPAAAERTRSEGALRRLHSYPSGSDTDASPPVRARGQHPPKPPVPERHPELLAMASRRAPPPPPPRTTSRSPLASPTSPSSPSRADAERNNSTEALPKDDKTRQALLEQRHQELLRKQKALQEQYAMTKMNLNLAPAGLSGSLTHLASNGDPCAGAGAACSPGSLGTKTSDTISTTNKVYETEIL